MRAALMPVAFPLVARPALLLIALGAGADRGLLPAALGMAAGGALLTALAAAEQPDQGRTRLLRWLVRLLAAGLVACGAIIAIAGLLDV
jgi:hypothetical protein